MAKKFVNLLKRLFDYQKFEQNESLNYEINSAYERNKNYVLEDNNLFAVVGGANNKKPGMECPRCKSLIPVSIEQVIKSGALVCPKCGLKLTIDQIKHTI